MIPRLSLGQSRWAARGVRSWQRITLRWRAVRRPGAVGARVTPMRPGQYLFQQTHWHLHLMRPEALHVQRVQGAVLLRHARVIERRGTLSERVWHIRDRVPDASVDLRKRVGAQRVNGIIVRREPSQSTVTRTPTSVVHRRVMPAVRPGLRWRADAPEPTRVARANVANVERVSSASLRHRSVPSQAEQRAVPRRITLAFSHPRQADSNSRARPRVVPPAQMTWRSATALSPDVERFAGIRPTLAAAPARAFADATPYAPADLLAARASAPVEMKDLDPRVIDRLADDVIRRVERRARIERERRGV